MSRLGENVCGNVSLSFPNICPFVLSRLSTGCRWFFLTRKSFIRLHQNKSFNIVKRLNDKLFSVLSVRPGRTHCPSVQAGLVVRPSRQDSLSIRPGRTRCPSVQAGLAVRPSRPVHSSSVSRHVLT